jgi:putative transposase
MNTYKRHRFPPDIISYTVWLYYRFNLSHRDIEDLLAERGITVSHESIRLWCIKFGAKYASRLKRRHQGYGDYGVARREVIPEAIHVNDQYANNRVEQSHEPTRVRERGMRKFKSVRQAQTFVTAHAAVHNLFNLGRHLVSANHYRNLRIGAFREWSLAVA